MTTKNLIFCFDGTSNHPKDAKQEREWFGLGEIEDNGITNILKLHTLFGGTLNNKPLNRNQHSFYYSGVGTYGNKIQRMFNAVFAPEKLDVGRIIKSAGADLRNHYKAGDRVYVFGFSRGAAIARRFASVIRDYLPEDAPKDPVVRFLGVFDTVASIGAPNLDDESKPVSDVVFEDLTASRNVAEALHLVSLDDKRTAFMPTLMNKDERITEIWFAGAHSDVGGGFWYDGLSDVSLEFMLDEIDRRAVGLTVLKPEDVNYNKLAAPKDEYRIDYDDVFIKPNPQGKIHHQDRWWPIAKATLTVRSVRVNKNDKAIRNPGDDELPIVHHTAVDRILAVTGYRPKALKGVRHRQLMADGSMELHAGIIDYIRP